MMRVLVVGTFDILHPGHLYYMERARELGEELWAIIARDSNISHKQSPVVPAEQRRQMVEALEVVDCAVLGSEHSIFERLREINPDVVALGYDQHHSVVNLQAEFDRRCIESEVVRVGGKPADSTGLYASSHIAERCVERDNLSSTEGTVYSQGPPVAPYGLDIPTP